VKRFPDNWRRNQHFGYNSVSYAHFQQFKGRFEKPFRWDRIYIHTTLSPQIFTANKNELGGWDEWTKSEFTHEKIHQEINLNERWWYQNSDMKDLHQLFDQQLRSEKNHD
jgi:hypothetical protein